MECLISRSRKNSSEHSLLWVLHCVRSDDAPALETEVQQQAGQLSQLQAQLVNLQQQYDTQISALKATVGKAKKK